MSGFFDEIYSKEWDMISSLNIHVVKSLCKKTGIETPVYVASDVEEFPEGPDDRLIAITRHFGADTYLAGSGGKEYMDLEKYSTNHIHVIFQEFNHPTYNQLFGAFEPFMSVIDLILNHGPESLSIIRGEGSVQPARH
jgi:hypothetical protein